MLKVNNLTIAPLFREVNFSVPRGEIVTLMAVRQREIDPVLMDGWGTV